MVISVVNFSEYTDAHVQEVLRAINRQIAEDFAPYWHRSGTLRLEGAVGREPDPDQPQELRGDAVVYLWDEVDQEAALGFHDLNYRGIPFSIVFTKLADDLGESWTVTLSHEALELLVDPEANLLVEGPHPEDSQRRIYHWYEVCDAVQAQSYAIDGVEVSNFVLPLYFTESEETGSRNDFLGDEQDPLPSFGVAAGGYIGFFDPETGQHDQFASPRGRSQERLGARLGAGYTRRTVRRQIEISPEPVLRRILQLGSRLPLPGPWFEGLAVDVRVRGGSDPFERLETAAAVALGADWRARWEAYEPTMRSDGPATYDLVPKQPVSPAEAWERAHALRDQPGIEDAEPEFVFFRPDSEAIEELPPSRRWAALFGRRALSESDDPEWSLEQIRAREVWAETRGERIVIGHPDTGFTDHPELGSGPGRGPVDRERGYDFLDDEDDARAEPQEDDWLPGGPGHGTSTASVIVSAPGRAPGHSGPGVSGVAPGATLVPLRVSNSVVHFSMRRLRKAIEYASAEGCHVISMSLGGPFPSRHLRRAIRAANDAGLILVAAAGNHIPFRAIVWPARYPEVIACAASNAREGAWSGSSEGDRIDVTAPGESVWRAAFDASAPGDAHFPVSRSSGTSYATAHVAGACALWLAKHGRTRLLARYGRRLHEAFRELLRRTSRPSPHLGPEFGPGILDVAALLAAPLPTLRVAARRKTRRATARADDDALAAICARFPHLPVEAIRCGLEQLLGTDRRGLATRLRAFGDELAFHFATDPGLCRRFAAQCHRSDRALRPVPGRSRMATQQARALDAASYSELRSLLARSASRSLASAL